MAKDTSFLLDDHFDDFITLQIQSGRFSSAGEVIEAALQLFEREENRKKELLSELTEGEDSGFLQTFDSNQFINHLHDKRVRS